MLSEELRLQEVSEEREGLPCSVRVWKVISNSLNCHACKDGLVSRIKCWNATDEWQHGLEQDCASTM